MEVNFLFFNRYLVFLVGHENEFRNDSKSWFVFFDLECVCVWVLSFVEFLYINHGIESWNDDRTYYAKIIVFVLSIWVDREFRFAFTFINYRLFRYMPQYLYPSHQHAQGHWSDDPTSEHVTMRYRAHISVLCSCNFSLARWICSLHVLLTV